MADEVDQRLNLAREALEDEVDAHVDAVLEHVRERQEEDRSEQHPLQLDVAVRRQGAVLPAADVAEHDVDEPDHDDDRHQPLGDPPEALADRVDRPLVGEQKSAGEGALLDDRGEGEDGDQPGGDEPDAS